MDKLLIVGAGATGAITASLLAEKAAQRLSLTVWDKGSGVGGRMTTRRNEQEHQIDLGAQYITRTSSNDEATLKGEIFKELVGSGVLVPFTGVIEGESPVSNAASCGNYVCLNGMNNVPRYFLNKSKANSQFRRQLKTVNIDIEKNQVECGWSQDGSDNTERFSGLILTMPVPQLLNLQGNLLEKVQKTHLDNLKLVQYSSRYAMALGFEDPLPTTYTWTAQYFKHPIIRYACWDHLKRNCVSAKPSLLIHTSVPFGLEHLEEDKDKVASIITKALPEVLPNLPSPSYTYLIRWRYSQVFKPYPGSPGCVVLHTNPLVVCTGDAFIHSNLEGCATAAERTVKTILESL